MLGRLDCSRTRTSVKKTSISDAFDDGTEFPSEVVAVHHRAICCLSGFLIKKLLRKVLTYTFIPWPSSYIRRVSEGEVTINRHHPTCLRTMGVKRIPTYNSSQNHSKTMRRHLPSNKHTITKRNLLAQSLLVHQSSWRLRIWCV